MSKNRKVFNKKSILTTALLLSASAFATLGACSSDGMTGYTLPTQNTVQVGFEYVPDFSLEEGVTAKVVDIIVPNASRSILDGNAFTPDVSGEYTYVVRFTKITEAGVSEKEERFTVKAVDTTAPTIGEIADKQVELGLYDKFAEDLANLAVSDNSSNTVSVYAESIVFDGETTLLGEGVTSYRLTNVGEYTVNFVAKDYDGNVARSSFKIVTTDTIAPVIQAQKTAIAWAKDGKVELPVANVVDNASYTLTVSVKDSLGSEVAVTDNKITAGVGAYTVTYTAKDTSNNQSSVETKLVVKENGTISDFAEKGEKTLWANDGVRVADGKLKVYYTQGNNFELNYSNGFVVGDWSNYVSLSASVTNNRGAKLSVTPYVLVNGAWKETATQSVAPNATANIKVYLADYDIEKVDGVKFALNCDGGVIVDFDDIKLSAVADDRVAPTGSTKYEISANGAAQVNVNATTKGVVKYTVYANVNCDVMMTLNYADGAVSATKSLKAGLNEITRYPDAEAGESVTSSSLENIVITNFEGYDITVYVSAITSEDISSIDMSAYAVTEGNYSVAYNETFAIPSPFTSSLRWYQDLTVSVKQGSAVVKDNLAIGSILETVGDNALSAGDYSIVYSFKDLAGASKTITYSLTVEQNVLTATLAMPALFYNAEGFDLPNPEITSAVYGNSTVQSSATVEKYYRLAGRKTWTEAEGGRFSPVANKTYEIKYVVEYDGVYREINAEKFIHVNQYTIDFEPEDAAGEMFAARYKNGEKLPDGTIHEGSEIYVKAKGRFLFDGGYYDYRPSTENRWEVTKDWSKSGSTSVTQFSPGVNGWSGFLIRPVIANDKGFNAISFWMKADKAYPDMKIEVGVGGQVDRPYNKGPWIMCEPFDLQAGEHFYTLFFQEPIPAYESIGSINILMRRGNRLYLDDLQFKYINRLEAKDTNTYEDQINHTNGYELIKPTITSELLSAEELAKVSFVLTYSLNGNKEKEIVPNAEGKYILQLAEEESGEVVFKWTITTPNKWSPDAGDLVRTFVSDKVLIKSVPLTAEHPEIVLQNSEALFDLPTADGVVSDAQLEYKPFGSDAWTVATKKDGKFVVNTDTVGWLDIRYSSKVALEDVTVDGLLLSSVYVRNPNVFIDYEGSDPFNGGCTYFDNSAGGSVPGSELILHDEATNNHGQRILVVNNSWDGVYFKTVQELGKTYNAIRVKMHSASDYKGYRILFGENGNMNNTYYVDLQSGWHTYVIPTIEFSTFSGFAGKMQSGIPAVTFDDLEFLSIEYNGEMPTGVIVAEEMTVPTATCGGISATLSYRLKGTEEWTAMDGVKFVPLAHGTYEIRYSFNGLFDAIREAEVGQNTKLLRATNEEIVMQGATVTLTAPQSDYDIANVKLQYKAYAATEWMAMDGYNFPTTTVGWYKVLYTADVTVNGNVVQGAYETEIYVRDPNVFLDFEGADPFRGMVTAFDNWYGGKISATTLPRDENGNTVQKIWMAANDSWEGVYSKTPVELGKTYNAVKVRVYCAKDYSSYRIMFGSTAKNYATYTVDLKAGWNDVLLEVPEFSSVYVLAGKFNAGIPQIMFDDISFAVV